jgi:hypothetical protein
MFVFTVAFAGVFLIPVTNIDFKKPVLQFYWRGFWIFLSMICAITGSANTLLLAKIPVAETAQAAEIAILMAFILFIVIAWFHLAGKAAWVGLTRFLHKSG